MILFFSFIVCILKISKFCLSHLSAYYFNIDYCVMCQSFSPCMTICHNTISRIAYPLPAILQWQLDCISDFCLWLGLFLSVFIYECNHFNFCCLCIYEAIICSFSVFLLMMACLLLSFFCYCEIMMRAMLSMEIFSILCLK